MPSLTPLYGLAFARMGVGIALLTAPAAATSAFLIPVAPVALLGIRLAGARDLAVGGLLLHTIRAQPPRVEEKPSTDSDTNVDNQSSSPLLGDHRRTAQAQHDSVIKAVLVTGMVIDGLDVLSCAVGFAEGTLPGDGALLVGGFAAGAVGLGWYNYLSRPRAARA